MITEEGAKRCVRDVQKYPLQQVLRIGSIAAFDLLHADEHGQAEHLIWQQYFSRNTVPPGSWVFTWPADLMKLSFQRVQSSLPTHLGWVVHFEVRCDGGQVFVLK